MIVIKLDADALDLLDEMMKINKKAAQEAMLRVSKKIKLKLSNPKEYKALESREKISRES